MITKKMTDQPRLLSSTQPPTPRFPQHLSRKRPLHLAMSFGGPSATISPPRSPPSGPRSITQSALRIMSRLCSITRTGITAFNQAVEHVQQTLRIGEVKAGRRFIEDVHGAASGSFGELARELHPLGFAAGERGGRLPEFHIVEPDVVQRLEFGLDVGNVLEKFQCIIDRHIQTSAMLRPCTECPRFPGCSAALAHLTSDIDVGQKCISILMSPSPRQASHRPPFTLKL